MSLTLRDPLSVIGVLIIGVLVVHEMVFAVRHWACPPAHCGCPLTHKFLAGLPLHGHVVTDATYWRAASKDLTQAKTVGPWLKLPRWKRRLYRTGPFVAAAALLVNWALTGTVLGVLAVCVTVRRARWVRRGLLRALGWAARTVGWVLGRSAAPLLRWLFAAWDERVPRWLRTERAWRLSARIRVRMSGAAARVLLLWGLLRHRNRVQTMGMLLATVAGTASSSAESGITWTPDYLDTEPGEVVARWKLPRGFKGTGAEKSLAQEVWQSRIGLALTFRWETQDVDEPELVMRRAREMPSKVYLHDVLEKVKALPDHKTAIGLDDQGNLVCWDWACENPHGMVVAGSRHGKTELNRSITAQVVRKGGRVGGVDCKRISFQGLEGVPGFTLRNNPRNIREMWELVEEFYDEMERRSLDREQNPTIEFKRWLLIIEEVNQFSAMTDDWWEEMEAEAEADAGTLFWKPKRGKKTPRVWRWIKSLCWEGAEFGMHVIVDGQDGEFQALKGVRNVLGMRLLGGYQPQQWKACVGTTPVPEAPSTKGRFCFVAGGQTWIQALLGNEDKNESAAIWRDFARAGRRLDGTAAPVKEPPDGPFIIASDGTVTRYQAPGQRDHDLARTGPVNPVDPRGIPVSIAEAVAGGYAPGATVQALRQDRYLSDKGQLPGALKFPKPVAEVRPGQTERFWSAEITEFNAARRGNLRGAGR